MIADTSISGRRVACELDAIIAWHGKPDLIISDKGTDLTSNAMRAWAQSRRTACVHCAGKPMQNGICEAFNGRIRDEPVDETIFYDLDHARSTLARRIPSEAPSGGARLSHPAEFAGALEPIALQADQLGRSWVALRSSSADFRPRLPPGRMNAGDCSTPIVGRQRQISHDAHRFDDPRPDFLIPAEVTLMSRGSFIRQFAHSVFSFCTWDLTF